MAHERPVQVWLATLTLTACTSRARALAAVLVRSIAPPHYAVSPVCLRELTLLKLPVLCYKHRRAPASAANRRLPLGTRGSAWGQCLKEGVTHTHP